MHHESGQVTAEGDESRGRTRMDLPNSSDTLVTRNSFSLGIDISSNCLATSNEVIQTSDNVDLLLPAQQIDLDVGISIASSPTSTLSTHIEASKVTAKNNENMTDVDVEFSLKFLCKVTSDSYSNNTIQNKICHKSILNKEVMTPTAVCKFCEKYGSLRQPPICKGLGLGFSEVKQKQLITKCELKKHRRTDDCWIFAGKKVYNMTEYISKHPGGTSCIMKRCTQQECCLADMAFHSRKAMRIWKSLEVGELIQCHGGSPHEEDDNKSSVG